MTRHDDPDDDLYRRRPRQPGLRGWLSEHPEVPAIVVVFGLIAALIVLQRWT